MCRQREAFTARDTDEALSEMRSPLPRDGKLTRYTRKAPDIVKMEVLDNTDGKFKDETWIFGTQARDLWKYLEENY